MRYHDPAALRRYRGRRRPEEKKAPPAAQPFEAFLVVDIEATCVPGGDFNYPNEIIELPVCLLTWDQSAPEGPTTRLKVVDEFRTYVKPTWRPTLTEFCTQLTGITQADVDDAPIFTKVMVDLEDFMVKHDLIFRGSGKRRKRFCWCSDGPFDIRDFIVKQCFIAKTSMPVWIQGDVLDVRSLVKHYIASLPPTGLADSHRLRDVFKRSLNIAAQLEVLGLPPFEGRQHCGIDDTRNVAKIVAELAKRGVPLLPNTAVHPSRRWSWMGKHGVILEEALSIPPQLFYPSAVARP